VDFDPRGEVLGIREILREGGEIEASFLGVCVVAVGAVLFEESGVRCCVSWARERGSEGQGEEEGEAGEQGRGGHGRRGAQRGRGKGGGAFWGRSPDPSENVTKKWRASFVGKEQEFCPGRRGFSNGDEAADSRFLGAH
jgi:hypothetical protein